MNTGNLSVVTTIFWSSLCFYPMDFRNLLGHRSTKPHHHDKVAYHGGNCSSYLFLICIFYPQ